MTTRDRIAGWLFRLAAWCRRLERSRRGRRPARTIARAKWGLVELGGAVSPATWSVQPITSLLPPTEVCR